jgi:predicted transcriptional regulator
MPEPAMWALIVSLVVLCFGITLRLTKAEHSLKLMDEEFKRFRSEIQTIKKDAQKTVLGVKESRDRSVKEVTQRYTKEIENLEKNMEQIKLSSFMLQVKRPKKSGS